MKIINPVGRTASSKEDFKAYRGCVCTGTVEGAPDSQSIYQAYGPSCTTCACSCNPQIAYNGELNNERAYAYAY